MREADCTKLVATQLGTIERELESGRAAGDERRTLHEMEAEYRAAL
jgi:hypothetical protein